MLHFSSNHRPCDNGVCEFPTKMLAILILLFSSHLISPDSTAATYGPVAGPQSSKPLHHHHHHHHHSRHAHRTRTHAVSPAPSFVPGCGQICLEPLTQSPVGTPCGCVYPMKVKLLLQVSVYAVFPVVNELEIEIATSTYLKQSQVVITGASADTENEFRTAVDVNLVPLGDRFDNLTAALTYQKFWHKTLSLNRTLFGDYEVVYIIYPGLPISPNHPNIGPSGSPGTQEFPITANFVHKSQKMNHITIFVIALSATVLLIACLTAISVILRYKKVCSSSNTVGPAFTSSAKKRCVLGALLSSDPKSSTPVSVVSTIPTSILSVKTFTLSEIEKATEKFSLKKVLGEGGFGCVYHGIMEDGAEVAVKLLNKDNNQNGDREFMAEVEMLSRLHHRNLVKLIGICIEKHIRCLVYELVLNGSVESHLHGVDKYKGLLDWDARLKIALGAARGLAYLHEDSNPHVIHRDFKASNVLLEDDFTPKGSNSGWLGKLLKELLIYLHKSWELSEYAMTGHLLVKSDVYSYGVVLLELLSGKKAVDMSQPAGEENLVTWARPLLTTQQGLGQLADPTLTGTYDFNVMAKVAAIASMCVHPEVSRRPFMGEVVQALKLIYTEDKDDSSITHLDSSAVEPDFKGDGSLWDTGDSPPAIYSSAFMTMDCSSSFNGFEGDAVTVGLVNRSGPLRTVRNSLEFYRLKGSISEPGNVD